MPCGLAPLHTREVPPTNSALPLSPETASHNRLPPGKHRSEEHTSELQSHVNLVCRLLLEKKKYLACGAWMDLLLLGGYNAEIQSSLWLFDMVWALDLRVILVAQGFLV